MVNTLITPYYVSPDEARNTELMDCLYMNIDNPMINHIILICQKERPVLTRGSEKVIFYDLERRPRYSDGFNLTKLIPNFSETGFITILCNSDIYFNEEAVSRIENLIQKNTIFALSRWDYLGEGKLHHHNNPGSQDSWVFMGSIKKGKYRFPLGVPGCDNRIAYELGVAGYNVINPSNYIRSIHLHLSEYRNYTGESKKVPEPYAHVHIT